MRGSNRHVSLEEIISNTSNQGNGSVLQVMDSLQLILDNNGDFVSYRGVFL
jgi:hypothetical protein